LKYRFVFHFIYKEKGVSIDMKMQMQEYALPVSCRQCGSLFDLSYDVAQLGRELELGDVMKAVRVWRATKKQLLCWDCRA